MKNNRHLLLVSFVSAVSLIGAGCGPSVQTAQPLTPTVPLPPPQATTEQATSTNQKTYQLSDVFKHVTEADCWTVINGKVYDLTKYMNQHPPGKQSIIDGCGKDASAGYNSKPNSGKPHSSRADATLEQYLLGDLK